MRPWKTSATPEDDPSSPPEEATGVAPLDSSSSLIEVYCFLFSASCLLLCSISLVLCTGCIECRSYKRGLCFESPTELVASSLAAARGETTRKALCAVTLNNRSIEPTRLIGYMYFKS